MTYKIILTIATLIVGFALSFTGFYLYSKKASKISCSFLKQELAFAPIYITSVILLSLLYFITPLKYDFIHNFSAYEVFVPLFLAGFCYGISLFPKTAKFINIALIISIGISAYFLPTDFMLFKGQIPLWIDRLILIVLWSIFACFYFILNGIDGILPIFNTSYLMILILLTALDASPLFYGLAATGLLSANGSFLIFNWHPSKIKISNNSCKIFGFMLGGLMIFSSIENLAPCFAIILTLFVLELLQSIIKKLSLHDRYSNLSSNTIYYQAHISGLTQNQVCFAIFKIQILFIVLGCFQAYLPNNHSLPIASLFLAAWFLNKLKHWDEPQKNIKEINEEFIKDIKQNFTDLKNKINRE